MGSVHSASALELSAFLRGRRGFFAGGAAGGPGSEVGAGSVAADAGVGAGDSVTASAGAAPGRRGPRVRPALTLVAGDGAAPGVAFWADERSAARFSSCARVHLKW